MSWEHCFLQDDTIPEVTVGDSISHFFLIGHFLRSFGDLWAYSVFAYLGFVGKGGEAHFLNKA